MYATVQDVEAGYRPLTDSERDKVVALLEEAEVIVDAYNSTAGDDAKRVVCCHMVRRTLGHDDVPMGATTGSMSALGYSQSWTMSGGSAGELYLTKLDKKLLGVGSRICNASILEDM